MLLLAPVDKDVENLCPGGLYTLIDLESFKSAYGEDWPKIAEKIFDPNRTKPEERSEVLKLCHPILAEVSADCDYAQRKRPVARLVAGVLVPGKVADQLEEDKKFSVAAYLRHGIAVTFQNPRGDWRPVYVSQFAFSLSPPDLPKTLLPIGRLRYGPLTDLRHWLAAQATRPGYLSV